MANSLFEFTRVESFMDDINRVDCFDTRDMDGITPNYKFILASDCADDINDCIDDEGTLINPMQNGKGVNIVETENAEDGLVSMLWSEGINGERTMSVADSTIQYSFGENEYDVKAIFLCNIADGTGYVIAYSINNKAITVRGDLILPCDGIVWSFRYGD